jgi:tripartite-type tricarboxylate transporter receptor subunit TctC
MNSHKDNKMQVRSVDRIDYHGNPRPDARMRCNGPKLLIAGLIAGILSVAPGRADAQDWPTRAVTVVVPFAAGGNTDIMARMASQRLAEELKQPFVVENRVGAAGALAATHVAKAAPDGYTLLFGAAPLIAVVPQIQKVTYDPIKDFAPVSIFGTGPFVLGISSAIPAKTVPEFVAYAKSRQINYGSAGQGSIGHLSGALFVSRAGLDAVHIPYRGGAPALAALLAGQIEMYFGNASELIPQADSGKIRILGVATERRMTQLPDVPTIGEFYPNFQLSSWNGFLAPARTPKEIVDKLAKHTIAAAKDPKIGEQLVKLGIEPNGTTPAEFTAVISKEQPLFDAAIKAANVKPE